MSEQNGIKSRRHFLKLAAGSTVAAAVVASGLLPRQARAQDLPHLSPDDATAKALGYVEDAATTKNPKHKAGDMCSNCQFYSGGPTGYGPCQLFPGKAVSSKGWCISHSPKQG